MSTPIASDQPTNDQPFRSINVKFVPLPTWLRVKENALRSNLPLCEYLNRLMAGSQPFEPAPLPERKPRRRPGTKPSVTRVAPDD